MEYWFETAKPRRTSMNAHIGTHACNFNIHTPYSTLYIMYDPKRSHFSLASSSILVLLCAIHHVWILIAKWTIACQCMLPMMQPDILHRKKKQSKYHKLYSEDFLTCWTVSAHSHIKPVSHPQLRYIHQQWLCLETQEVSQLKTVPRKRQMDS